MYFEIEKQAIDAINKALDQYDVEVDRNFRLDFPPNPKMDINRSIPPSSTKKLNILAPKNPVISLVITFKSQLFDSNTNNLFVI